MTSRIVGLVGCGAALCFLMACSATSGSSSGNPAAPAGGGAGTAGQGGTYQLDPTVTSLRVNADAASVNVTAQDSASAISVTEETRGAATTKEVSGANAVLTAKCPSGVTFGDNCRVVYTVTMPAKVALDIQGAAGDIVLTGPLVKATVNTAAARIAGTGLGAGTFQATTDAGQIDLAFAAAPMSVEVKSTAGAVTLTVPGSEKYNVSVDTTIGSQEVSVDKDPSSSRRLSAETTVGSVTIKKG